jgi:hypothetical protein
MTNKYTGGTAFPVTGEMQHVHNTGMTLRDYFAAKAMQGLISQSGRNALVSPCDIGAEYAYKMADSMLEARQ